MRKVLGLSNDLSMARSEGFKQCVIITFKYFKTRIGKHLKPLGILFSFIVGLVFLGVDIYSANDHLNLSTIVQLVCSILLTVFNICDGVYFVCGVCYNRHCKVNKEDKKACSCLPWTWTTLMDMGRIFLIELLVYVQFMFKMFVFIGELVTNDYDISALIFTTIKWIISAVAYIVLVYALRIFILAQSVYSVKKVKGIQKCDWKTFFHIWFIIQGGGQMLVQMLMMVIIGVRHHHEYSKGYKAHMEIHGDQMVDYSYKPSGQLWYMMIIANITPVLGLAMFLLVHHYWTQTFSIDLILEMMKMMQKPGIGKALNLKGNIKKFKDLADKINQSDFKDYCAKATCCVKILYPFQSPLHVALCFLYYVIIVAFGMSTALNGAIDGWHLLYLLTIILVFIVNYYPMAIVMVWTWMFTIVLIGLLFFPLPFFIYACVCHGLSNSPQRTTINY